MACKALCFANADTNWPPGARALVVTTETLTPNSQGVRANAFCPLASFPRHSWRRYQMERSQRR